METSYRLLNRVRARTTSWEPGLRLLLVGIASLITNLWLYLTALLVARTPRGTRAGGPSGEGSLDTAFRLDCLCDLLREAMKRVHSALLDPFRLAAPLRS